MRKPMLAALAILFVGTIVLPGCFYAGPVWWDPDHDGHWERHRERRERHGTLTPHEEQRRNDHAQHVQDGNSAG